MSHRALVVDDVIRREEGRVAVHVTEPEGVDLQFIYRAALGVYWNPAEAMLEDRSDVVQSAKTSASRIAQALRAEYGLVLEPSQDTRWSGFIDEERGQVASALFG